MRLGADGMDEDEIARRLADVGANLNATFDVDRAGYAMRTLSSEAEQQQALTVLARVLQAPSFPEAVLEREKARVIAGLKEADTKPDSIAARTFCASGVPRSSLCVARDRRAGYRRGAHARATGGFYRAHYNAGRAVVAIMGDVTRERAERDRRSSSRASCRDGRVPLPPLPPVPPLAAAIERDIEHPSAQAHILIGQPGISAQRSRTIFRCWVGNYILGGGGSARGCTSRCARSAGCPTACTATSLPYQQPGPFQIGLQTRRDQAQEALAVVRKVLRRFRRHGPTEHELEARSRISSAASRCASTATARSTTIWR